VYSVEAASVNEDERQKKKVNVAARAFKKNTVLNCDLKQRSFNLSLGLTL
jgi:hypothetical protein